MTLGYQIEKYGNIDLSKKGALQAMLCIMLIMTFDARYVWRSYDFYGKEKKFLNIKLPHVYTEKDTLVTKTEYLRTWGILNLLNLPVLFAVFPGFFVYDAQDELNEVLTRSFTSHHPLVHVLLLGGIIALFHKLTGMWNVGIFVYTLFQMLAITAIFAYVITFLKKRGVGKRFRILWMIYYGVFPPIVMFTLCSSKDGLFSALLLLLTVFLIELFEDTTAFTENKKKQLLFMTAAVLTPCFRHNGFYAYLVFVPIALLFLWKKMSKKLAGMLILPVVIYLIFTAALQGALTNGETHHQEMLTVPIMQLARVYKYDKESMTEDEINTLKSFIPEENLDMYTGKVSDLVKVGFNNELYESDKNAFWNLYFSQLKKHPMTYVNAWLLTSYGYFFPAASFDVYEGTTVFTFTYGDNTYFGYETELPGKRMSAFPAIDALYRYISIGSFFKDAPILSLFFKPGLYVILYMFIFFYRISRKRASGFLPFLPMVLTYMTVLLGPTYLVRYVLILFLVPPLIQCTGETL